MAERPMKDGFLTSINRWVSHHIVKASATQNVESEQVGVLNRRNLRSSSGRIARQEVESRGHYTLKFADACRSRPHCRIRFEGA
jgi:beta-hydroxylase